VTPPGYYSLSIDGDFELGGFVFKDGYPFLHNDGGPKNNTALGRNALVSLTPGVPYYFSGSGNTALGDSALQYNTGGERNTGLGDSALMSNEVGQDNTAIGALTLQNNDTGTGNTATGSQALLNNTDGIRNTANGAVAMWNNKGSRNIALGYFAGINNTTGSNNIWIGHYGDAYPATESNTLRIGHGTGTGYFQQNRAFISGIYNVVNGLDEHPVCVDDDDQLGVCSESSVRFKSQISEMGALSASLLDLRPVVFRYKRESKRGVRPLQYGLIAEEVAEVFPHLVRYDDEGRPLMLRYDLLTPLLLNELQRQNRQNQVQWFLMGGILLAGVVVTVGRWRFA
jgi:hypothetical protein